MKREYTKPEITIQVFTTEDIITSSGLTTEGMKNGGTVNADSASGIKIDLSDNDKWVG